MVEAARQWIDEELANAGSGAPLSAARRERCPATRTFAGGGSDGEVGSTERAARSGRGSGWIVLAEELVCYPPLAADAERGRGRIEAESQPGRGPRSSNAARDRRHAGAWLAGEVAHLRALADEAYPGAPSFGRVQEARRGRDGLRAMRLPSSGGSGLLVACPGREQPARPVPSAGRRLPAQSAGRRAPAARAHARPTRRAPVTELRGLRRLLPGVATLAVLAGFWCGVEALSQVHRPHPVEIPGSKMVSGQLIYVARPGDTLWSIATRLVPNGDPRPVVTDLQHQLRGSLLLPGDRLVLP